MLTSGASYVMAANGPLRSFGNLPRRGGRYSLGLAGSLVPYLIGNSSGSGGCLPCVAGWEGLRSR